MRFAIIVTMLLAVFTAVFTMTEASASTSTQAWISTYTWNNNSPPGAGISYAKEYGYPTVHNKAGGIGTYDNPITFAFNSHSNPGLKLKPGTRIWIPFFKRYFILEDDCATCYTDRYQVDLWAGKAPDDSYAANIWMHKWIQINPPRGLPVIPRPLYP